MVRYKIILEVCSVLLLIAANIFGKSSTDTRESCDRQRKVFTSTYGIISSGNKEYPVNSHCEWLIQANSTDLFITLHFTKMDTECSYDHVFIYDGDSYSSPLLGSFSGNTIPPAVTSRNDAMLILLYSDTNYVRNGFEAFYVITDCPVNCSEKGSCINHRCFCDPPYSGEACEITLCPNNCRKHEGKGECVKDNTTCKCKTGYAGVDCSLHNSYKNNSNTWHTLSFDDVSVSKRAGHTGIYIKNLDMFFVFGGYTFGKVISNLEAFSFSNNKWINYNHLPGPLPRRDHAAVSFGDTFLIFGGELQNGTLSNELWWFNTSSLLWYTKPASKDSFWPPPLTKHSMTLVEDQWIYIYGGSLSDSSFSSNMYKFSLNNFIWKKVVILGGKQRVSRLVGHSAIYYSPLKSIFIFGGVIVEYSYNSKLSNHIYAFHIEKNYWTRISFAKDPFVPLERAFHRAAVVGDYMFVYGGYTHKHSEEEICYDNVTYFYHLRCHKWIDATHFLKNFGGSVNPVSQGVFSHAMAVRYGHTLLIHGGYSGIMRSTFLAYIPPAEIIGNDLLNSPCASYTTLESCTLNFACGWCLEGGICVERKNKVCKNLYTSSCPGLCPVLNNCHSCLIWSDLTRVNTINDDHLYDVFSFTSCSWCVQLSQCLPVQEASFACSLSSNNTSLRPSHSSSIPRWWGNNETVITFVNQCYTNNSQPGLVSVKYRYPINIAQPDEVSYIKHASENLSFHPEPQRNDSLEFKENTVKLVGFLHPFGAKPLSERFSQLQLRICSAGSSAVLKLSKDSTAENFEIVANHSGISSYYCSDAHRPNLAPLFPNVTRGYKYLLEFTVKSPASVIENSSMQLEWNTFTIQSEVIEYQHLEPFKNGSCALHNNCLACLTDTSCGWCNVNSKCFKRINAELSCIKKGQSHFLIIEPTDCTVCSDYAYCEQCTQTTLCEWLPEYAYCVRRGRYEDAVRSSALCPIPCNLRHNCSSCLGDIGVCAWCESRKTCFLFSTYTTSYMYGQCRDWIDENRATPDINPVTLCRDCTQYKDCKSCLRDLTCGWCSFANNPLLGACASGDFSNPSEKSCLAHLKERHGNIKSAGTPLWSYSTCPDIEECLLDLHDCHSNATCYNTPESYVCKCNDGFKGDGRVCTRACSVNCVNGYCSEAPDYKCICNLGWTGEDCSIDCGCHNHSTCNKEIGICDQCQNWTEGEFCEKCRPGSYGNALSSVGCQECNCNSHGDPSLNFCNSTSGVCYCVDNTEGPNCTYCNSLYYGDPRNGGHCFLKCEARSVITEATKGKFGSPIKYSLSDDCLWLITVYSVLDMPSLLEPMPSTEAVIELVIHEDIYIPCPHNHIYVYDGLPHFIAPGHPNILLGAVCGSGVKKPIQLVATSGYLTIHFKRNAIEYGFNATYKRLEHCIDSNRTSCYAENCENFINDDDVLCDLEPCPKNCSASQNFGVCHSMYGKCICESSHGGEDCSAKLGSYNLAWFSLYNYKQAVIKSDIPSGRMGHSLLTVYNKSDDAEHLWLYGGFSATYGDMDDLFMFEVFKREWIKVENKNAPRPRHFHAAVSSGNSIYIFGGLSNNEVLGDFWEYNTLLQTWTELTVTSDFVPLAGSTLAAIQGGKLVLIGGFSPNYGFFEKLFEFDTASKVWHPVNSSGAQPIGIYGHSSVYHLDTESIYVFGGMTYEMDIVTVTNNLYALHYPSKQWYRLPADKQVNPLKTRPQPRYFHDAVITKYYMVIFGGLSIGHSTEILQPYAYIFSCNLWISLGDEDIDSIGNAPGVLVGGTASIANGDIYVFGNFDGEMKKLSIPTDMCDLFSLSRVGCIHHTGCAFCSVYENGINQTFCYSQKWHIPTSCYNPKGASEVVPAVSCNAEWIEKRDCTQYSSCTDCVASWPMFKDAKQVCQWCSSCKMGRCIPTGSSCESENDCNIPRRVVNQSSLCPLRVCLASDCEKCQALKMCIWTRQVRRSSGFGHMLNKKPIYNWVCVMKEIQEAPPFPIKSMPPLKCPLPCIQYTNCSLCLQSSGGEGGWHQCFWSETLQMCMSPSFELMKCRDGSCGSVIQGNVSLCPIPCWQHEQASHCLAHANCGWCAFSGPQVDGRGLCMEGGIMGPTGGLCRENQVLLLGLPLPAQTAKWLAQASGPPSWHYLNKPLENECANGHHTCDERHEECVDTPMGFECKCKQGYELKGSTCQPVCSQGCANGTCIRPDFCQCNFGYVGSNCSVACKCNGHSNCPGLTELDNCLECHNNTQGQQCQKCKPFFVGNPVNGGKCIPCREYCYGHSNICLSSEFLSSNSTVLTLPLNQTAISEIFEKVTEGPWDDAICIDCQNNTEGTRCDQCVTGYFKAGENSEDGCRPCECHGHGDICNPLNGESCNCQNNTENDRQCSQKNSKNIITPCWQLQCSKCKEYFLGSPTHGHQCYRHMFLDKDYCFDPGTQGDCNTKPSPLLQGRTVFFAVQPRYMNVDIRIVVDVTEGGIDFLLSAKDDTFVVEVNKTTGIHYISIDKKYGLELQNYFDFLYYRKSLTNNNRHELMLQSPFQESANFTDIIVPSSLREDNNGLTTYITMTKSQEFLFIRSLENRLVVTIPQAAHDLRTTRFYMVLRGVGSEIVASTYGSLFFRQDQTRIDLFVFFSVFFSCFFLFLAICVVVWKVKQAFDIRRARRLHAAEMKHMASRPFGHVITIVDEDRDDFDFSLYSPTNCRKKAKYGKVYGRDSPKTVDEKYCLRPLAVEPLADGTAAVATILVQLPGGAQSLVKMTLASALITTRSSHYHMGCGIRAAMRRRTSHVNI